jgi:hypothetical protein
MVLVDAERRVFVGGVGPFEEAMGPECIRLGKGLRVAMGFSASPPVERAIGMRLSTTRPS